MTILLKPRQTRFPVKEVPKALKDMGVRMGYTGLMYYRSLGLIPSPEKGEGTKERFYDILELLRRIHSIKLMSSVFDLNFQELSSFAKRLPPETFEKLPLVFMRVYVDVQAAVDKKKGQAKGLKGLDSLDLDMFDRLKEDFLDIVRKSDKATSCKSVADYMNTIKGELLFRYENQDDRK
jgi:hypothetical protein